jgi:hypothetical protein
VEAGVSVVEADESDVWAIKGEGVEERFHPFSGREIGSRGYFTGEGVSHRDPIQVVVLVPISVLGVKDVSAIVSPEVRQDRFGALRNGKSIPKLALLNGLEPNIEGSFVRTEKGKVFSIGRNLNSSQLRVRKKYFPVNEGR